MIAFPPGEWPDTVITTNVQNTITAGRGTGKHNSTRANHSTPSSPCPLSFIADTHAQSLLPWQGKSISQRCSAATAPYNSTHQTILADTTMNPAFIASNSSVCTSESVIPAQFPAGVLSYRCPFPARKSLRLSLPPEHWPGHYIQSTTRAHFLQNTDQIMATKGRPFD